METSNKKLLQDLVIMKSARLAHHRVIPLSKQEITPLIRQYCDYLSVDSSLQRKFLLCQWCEQVFTNSRANRRNIEKHLIEKHNLGQIQSCPSPVPEIKSEEKATIKKPSKRGRPIKLFKHVEDSNKFPILKIPTSPIFRVGPLTIFDDFKSILEPTSTPTPPPNSPTQTCLEVKMANGPEPTEKKIGEGDLAANMETEKEVGSGVEDNTSMRTKTIKLKKDKVRAPKKLKLVENY